MRAGAFANPAGQGFAAVPAWVLSGAAVDLDFADLQYYSDPVVSNSLTCNRSSTGYVLNADFSLSSVAANTLRISANRSVTNNFKQSQTLASVTNVARATVTSDVTTAPDGTLTADQVTDDSTASNTHYIANGPVGIQVNSTYTLSAYLKQGGGTSTGRYVALNLWSYNNPGQAYVVFDLQNGLVFSTTTAGSGVVSKSNIQSVGSGWYRCSVTGICDPTDTQMFPAVMLCSSAGAISYTGNSTGFSYVWGVQLEFGSTVGDYLATGATVPLAGQFGSPGFGLLVEESRTNLVLQSQFAASWNTARLTITANNAVAPDGTTTAALFKEDTTASASHRANQFVTKAASSLTYTYTVYAKLAPGATRTLVLDATDSSLNNGAYATYDFNGNAVSGASGTFGSGWTLVGSSSQALANGWFRITMTVTSDTTTTISLMLQIADAAGNGSYTGDGSSGIYYWGCQLEQASFATSYIPTTTTSATRAADSIPFASSVEAIIRGSAGSCYARGGPTPNGANNARIWGSAGAAQTAFFANSAGNDASYNGTTTLAASLTAGYTFKDVQAAGAEGWSAAGRSVVGQGGTVATDANTVPDDGAGNYSLGQFGSGSAVWDAYMQRFALWNSRLADATLQSLTTPPPQVDLNFASAFYYPNPVTSMLTCSRSSNGYAQNSDGSLTNFANNVLRIGTGVGLLVEESRTNLLLQSQTIDNATWSKGGCTVTANQAVAPDGTTTAESFVENSGAGTNPQFNQTITKAASPTKYTLTIYVKALSVGSHRWISLFVSDSSFLNLVEAVFDLNTGALSGSRAVLPWVINSTSSDTLGNGWFRLKFTYTTDVETTDYFFFSLSNTGAANSTNYTGDGVSGAYVWGVQVEQASFPTSYIPTTTTSATRAADFVKGAGPLLHITAAGTVLEKWSQFVASNASDQRRFATSVSDGGNSRWNWRASDVAGTEPLFVVGNGTSNSSFSTINYAANVTISVAGAWDGSTSNASINGSAPGADGGGFDFATNSGFDWGLGNDSNGAFLCGYIQRFATWTSRLSNSALASLTQ